MMMARSLRPALVIAALKPSPIDNTATKTTTTPVMPTTATSDELSRCGMVRMLTAVTASACFRNRIGSAPPQRVGDPQPHRRDRRNRSGQGADGDRQHE